MEKENHYILKILYIFTDKSGLFDALLKNRHTRVYDKEIFNRRWLLMR